METLIVIPARYGSTRLPGKPLQRIAGRTLLSRVASIAVEVRANVRDVTLVVATDDARIQEHAEQLELSCVVTDPAITSGSARSLAAARALGLTSGFVLNLQGDAPFINPDQVLRVLEKAWETDADVVTPLVQLSWSALDMLRKIKQTSPHSGTTCVRSTDGTARWFSKMVIPAIRGEDRRRSSTALSPVFQHIGLYCYRFDALERFHDTPISFYEEVEGLEQLRLIEAGTQIMTVVVEPSPIVMSGIDSPADLKRAEALISQLGDPFVEWRALN